MRLLPALLMCSLVITAVVAAHFGWLSEFANISGMQQHRALEFSDVYIHHGDNVANVPFHAGDYLFAHYKIHRGRTCIVTIQFRLTQPRAGDTWTGLLSYGYPLVSYYGPPSLLETNEVLHIPPVMPPGAYELRRQNYLDCGGEKWVEIAPPALLTIVP